MISPYLKQKINRHMNDYGYVISPESTDTYLAYTGGVSLTSNSTIVLQKFSNKRYLLNMYVSTQGYTYADIQLQKDIMDICNEHETAKLLSKTLEPFLYMFDNKRSKANRFVFRHGEYKLTFVKRLAGWEYENCGVIPDKLVQPIAYIMEVLRKGGALEYYASIS